MAEAVLCGIAKSILKQLGSPALKELGLLWGHKSNLEKLKNTVTTISIILEGAAPLSAASEAVIREWHDQLRRVLYEADDLFDAITAKFLLEKEKKGTMFENKVINFLSTPYRFTFLVKIAHKVKGLRERFAAIASDIAGFAPLLGQPGLDPTSSSMERVETYSFFPRNEIIGREKEVEDLVMMLLPGSSSKKQRGFSVIAVIGMGGVGKTTLAQVAYDDERVVKSFDLRMWACINYFSPLQNVLIRLLKQYDTDRHIDELQSSFRKHIAGKRFLLILDNLWDEDHTKWRELEHLLSGGKDGSKILITTRAVNVADSLRAIKPYIYLRELSDESAWLLFKNIAFGKEGDQQSSSSKVGFGEEGDWKSSSSEFEKLGQQIVKKCANLPLAIITIASLLIGKDKESWFPLINHELSQVVDPEEYGKIMQVLAFSYKKLPYPIKRCFGYCSLFPKNHNFQTVNMVRLWMAQGFVEPLIGQSLEDTAEEYLFYLVNRCFFQLRPTRDDEMRSIATFHMHDLMHDLATKVVGSESVVIDQTENISWENNVYHLSINRESTLEYSMERHVDPHSKILRTFLRPCRVSLGQDTWKNLLSGYRSLRVLDLSYLKIKRVPTSIEELIHLRFLDLSGNDIGKLPTSICRLRHLQSLILRECRDLKELPKDLGDLLSLRHLVLEGCYKLVKMPPGLAALTSLVTLDKLVVHNPSGGLKYLEGLDSLTGSLEIELPSTEWESAATDAKGSLLSKKSRLHALDITHSWYEPDTGANTSMINVLQLPPDISDLRISYFGGREMPSWVSGEKLVILKLFKCNSCINLPPLSHLPSLREMDIGYMSSMVAIEEFYTPSSLFFRSLETLSISHMRKWNRWWVQAPTDLPTFPRLRRVYISECRELTRCMPSFDGVEDLSLEGVPEESIVETIESEREQEEQQIYLQELHSIKLGFECAVSMINNPRLLHGLQRLTGLQKLTLCRGRMYLSSWRALIGLPHLRDLSFLGVYSFINDESDASWRLQTLPISMSIRDLSIKGCYGEWVNEIPWQSFPYLEYLSIGRIHELEALPEGIRHLSNIQILCLVDLEGLKSLPDWMRSLSYHLHHFQIYGASEELKNRCRRGTGEDWPLIQQIPNIWIEEEREASQ